MKTFLVILCFVGLLGFLNSIARIYNKEPISGCIYDMSVGLIAAYFLLTGAI